MSSAEQQAEHDKRNAAGGAGTGYTIAFIAGDIQGKPNAVIAGNRPLPTLSTVLSYFY